MNMEMENQNCALRVWIGFNFSSNTGLLEEELGACCWKLGQPGSSKIGLSLTYVFMDILGLKYHQNPD